MADPFIPPKDSDALTAMETFSDGISEDPQKYFCSQSDAENIALVVLSFRNALKTAVTPATRTPLACDLKDETRAIAEQTVRAFANLIRPNAGISNQDKLAIGVRPINKQRTPIYVPTSSPLLNVLGATPAAHTVRYADSNSPDRAAKPFGATSLQLYVAVGEAAVGTPDTADFYGAFTKNPIGVLFSYADDGKVATYFARWADRKGEVGPWSLPVAMRIAA